MSVEKKSEPTGGESYHIGDVGAHARVQQGKYLTMIEKSFADTVNGDDLKKQFKELIGKLAESPELDEEMKDLSMEQTHSVAEALAKAKESPSGLRRALLEAKHWFSSAASWVWDEVSEILKSDAAQKTISTITESSVRAAIKSIL